MPKLTTWQRFKSATSKSLGLVETSASALDYGLKALEIKAFLVRASVITDAVTDDKIKQTLQNVVLSEDDSDNIRACVESIKLHNQARPVQPTIASNLNIH